MDGSWGTDEAWMRITWGTWKIGGWGWNITLETLYVSVGYVWGAWATRASKCVLDRLLNLDVFWCVLMWGRFQAFCFEAHVSWCIVSDWRKQALGLHQNMTCFCVGLLQACAWKPTPGRLEARDAFSTCHWNNVAGCLVCDSRQ
jgi:hypothetical protein